MPEPYEPTEPTVAPEPGPSPEPTPEPMPDAATEEQPNLIDSATELLQTAVTYVRQETEAVVREKVVLPTQKAGATVGMAIAVALVLFLGVIFISAGALILLAQYVGWPAALFIVGGILIITSITIGAIRMRSLQT